MAGGLVGGKGRHSTWVAFCRGRHRHFGLNIAKFHKQYRLVSRVLKADIQLLIYLLKCLKNFHKDRLS